MKRSSSVDAYIASAKKIQGELKKLRETIKKVAPNAQENLAMECYIMAIKVG